MKTKKQHKHFAYLIIVVVLFGCSELNRSVTATPSSVIHPETEAITPIITSPAPTVTLSATTKSIPVCQGKDKHIIGSSNSVISGTIIYQNDDSTGLYTVGGTPVTGSQLLADETQQSVVFGFSPDGNWLAYSPFDTNSDTRFDQLQVTLLSADGEKVENILSTTEFEGELQVGHQLIGVSGYSYWINAQLIYVTLYSQNPDPNKSGYISDLPKVLNPFDGEWNSQFLELPGRFPSDVFGLSPDTSRALYKENGLSLWDYEQQVQLWHDESVIAPNRALIYWSPDSSRAVYANLYDSTDDQPVLLITKVGDLDSIVTTVSPIPGFRIRNTSWSPNSQYLALAGLDGENLNVLIYDIFSGEYISQCPVAKLQGSFPSLVWSPDNSHIAISQIDSPILIFDVLSGAIHELDQQGRVVGWSNKFPVVWP